MEEVNDREKLQENLSFKVAYIVDYHRPLILPIEPQFMTTLILFRVIRFSDMIDLMTAILHSHTTFMRHFQRFPFIMSRSEVFTWLGLL